LLCSAVDECVITQRREAWQGWQRRTLPPRYHGSTIRAGELNDRVRDETGWTLAAPATNTRHASRLWAGHKSVKSATLTVKSRLAACPHPFTF
jgi:hypothetical protein